MDILIIKIIPWIIVVCWVTLIITWVVTAFGVKHDVKKSLWRRFVWLRIVIIFIILSILWERSSLGAFDHVRGIFQTVYPSPLLFVVGSLLCILGIGYAIWARIHLGRNWSPIPNVKEDHELITSGPYRLVRHPIYTGIILATLGTGLVIPIWFFVFFIMTGNFIWRVKKEEALMTKQFPDQYPEYMKRTWALVPWVW